MERRRGGWVPRRGRRSQDGSGSSAPVTGARDQAGRSRGASVAWAAPASAEPYSRRIIGYLEAVADYREFALAKELDRVPSSAYPLDAEQTKRLDRILATARRSSRRMKETWAR